MDGLGYNLVYIGGSWYYNCNYKGYEFTVVCGGGEITDDTYISYYKDIEGGDHQKTVTYKRVVNDANSQGVITSYFNVSVKSSEPFLTWCANNWGKALAEVEFFGDQEEIDAKYTPAQQATKWIRTTIAEKLMVYDK